MFVITLMAPTELNHFTHDGSIIFPFDECFVTCSITALSLSWLFWSKDETKVAMNV